jgi:hypothetical protein
MIVPCSNCGPLHIGREDDCQVRRDVNVDVPFENPENCATEEVDYIRWREPR